MRVIWQKVLRKEGGIDMKAGDFLMKMIYWSGMTQAEKRDL